MSSLLLLCQRKSDHIWLSFGRFKLKGLRIQATIPVKDNYLFKLFICYEHCWTEPNLTTPDRPESIYVDHCRWSGKEVEPGLANK